MKFTGHERDFTVGSSPADDLDYMHARFYGPLLGRFLSVDPATPEVAMQRPQRWNRYAYGLNNPMTMTDPNGEEAVVFIVDEGKDNLAELAGHAAIYVRRGQREGGISYGTPRDFSGGVRDFLSQYLADSRGVSVYFLQTTASQDEAMLDFIEDNPDGGVDRDALGASQLLRENCTTAVCNVLESGGILSKAEDILGLFHPPSALELALEIGSLSGLVETNIYITPRDKKHRLKLEEVMNRIDSFAGTGFCSADNICH